MGEAILPQLQVAWDGISSAVSVTIDWFKDLLKPVNSTKEELDAARDAGSSFGEILGLGIRAVFLPLELLVKGITWVIEKMNVALDLGQKVKDQALGWIPFGDDDPEQSPALSRRIQKAARNGSVSQVDNSTTQVTMHVNGGDPQEVEKRIKALFEQKEREQKSKRRASLVDAPAF